MTLMLVNHGGKCCGIKIIYGFECPPCSKEKVEPQFSGLDDCHADVWGQHVSSKDRFFTHSAPEETTLERLDRYIAYIRVVRPKHLIEVTLSLGRTGEAGQSAWAPVLEERGFVLVTKFKNSNSGNFVGVYHLKVGQ